MPETKKPSAVKHKTNGNYHSGQPKNLTDIKSSAMLFSVRNALETTWQAPGHTVCTYRVVPDVLAGFKRYVRAARGRAKGNERATQFGRGEKGLEKS